MQLEASQNLKSKNTKKKFYKIRISRALVKSINKNKSLIINFYHKIFFFKCCKQVCF